MEGRLTSDLTHAPASLSQALDSPQSCEVSIQAPRGWPGLPEKGQWVVGRIQAQHPWASGVREPGESTPPREQVWVTCLPSKIPSQTPKADSEELRGQEPKVCRAQTRQCCLLAEGAWGPDLTSLTLLPSLSNGFHFCGE